MRCFGAFALMGLMASAWHPAASQETTASSNGESSSIDQVWRREDEYWRSAKAGDVGAYLSLWHDKFIGWPCDEAHSKRKAAVGGWVREVREKDIRMTYDLDHEGAEDFGNVVVVHYRVTGVDTYPDGHIEGEGEESKITHTRMRIDDAWLIIGGMCGSLRDSAN